MGCATSKLDDLPAVALCRERCSSLDEAISLRYSLSNSHLSYFIILSSLSPSFISFFPYPIPIPTPKPPPPTSTSAAAVPHRSSRSGSHIDFDDDDDSDDDSDDLHHDPYHDHYDSGDLSPLHLRHHDGLPAVALQQFPNDNDVPPGMGGFFSQGGGFFNMNYMRNKAFTPSVIYEQHPVSYQTVKFGEASSSSSSAMPPPGGYPPYPYQTSSSSYPGNAVIGGGGGDGDGGMFDPNYGYPGYGSSGIDASLPPRQSYGAQVKPPAPPPSPPRASPWDFLNPFEGYEKSYPAYTSSRDFMELREEEGIPDLEDEHEVVKEVHGNPKFVYLGKNHDHTRKGVVVEEEEEDEDDDDEDDEDEFHRKAVSEASMYQARPSVVSIGNDEGNDNEAEYEVHVVDKKVVDGEGRSGPGGGGATRGSRSVAEALAEIEVQFRRASECGNEIARMLEMRKLPYNRKHRGIILPVVY